MASYGDVRVGVSVDTNCMRCCCAGLGLVRQKLEGSGTVFLAGTGTIVQKVLADSETILVDTNCIMAFADTCKLDLKRAGGILVCSLLVLAKVHGSRQSLYGFSAHESHSISRAWWEVEKEFSTPR
jgi:hypothetical protein